MEKVNFTEFGLITVLNSGDDITPSVHGYWPSVPRKPTEYTCILGNDASINIILH